MSMLDLQIVANLTSALDCERILFELDIQGFSIPYNEESRKIAHIINQFLPNIVPSLDIDYPGVEITVIRDDAIKKDDCNPIFLLYKDYCNRLLCSLEG